MYGRWQGGEQLILLMIVEGEEFDCGDGEMQWENWLGLKVFQVKLTE